VKPSEQKILSELKEQDPKAPWLDIQQIIEKTGLGSKTVYRNLPSLLESGLVVEYPRPQENLGLPRYFADASKEIEGIQPLNRTTRRVLGVVAGQNPENPWIDIQQIIEKTGLDRRTVITNLTSLLESGLVVEYPREREGQQRRNFADALKQVVGIEPQEIRKKQEDLEYVPKVSLGQQEAVLVAFLMALTKGYPWLKLDQIRGFDHPFRQNLQDIKFNQLSELLERLIQEKLVRSKVEGQHKYYALTPEGIRSAQTVNKRV
jgi:DNA-binding MarR family transcriptional regulator